MVYFFREYSRVILVNDSEKKITSITPKQEIKVGFYASKKASWKESCGSWEKFHERAERAVGKKLEKITVQF